MKNQSKRAPSYRLLSVLTLVLFFSVSALAQQITIKGNVKEASGEPIIGANVLVTGTTNGTITDLDGNFEVYNVDENATIEVSFIGYHS